MDWNPPTDTYAWNRHISGGSSLKALHVRIRKYDGNPDICKCPENLKDVLNSIIRTKYLATNFCQTRRRLKTSRRSEPARDYDNFHVSSNNSPPVMAHDLTIRTATAEDVDLIAQFNQRMAQETENKTLDSETVKKGVQTLFDEPSRGFYLVAVRPESRPSHAERPASDIHGSLMITTEWSDWRNGAFWWIQSVYVRPEVRRKGVYRAMHRAVRRRATTDETVCGLRLYVERGNEIARETYEALGMTETSYRMYEEML